MQQQNLGVGIIGCGNISAAYLRLAPLFKGFEIRSCADLDHDAAAARAEEFGIRAESAKSLLEAGDIDVVVNLTIPAAHYEVSKSILEAGKHVYSEKPFVLSLEEGQLLTDIAADRGLRIGSAPDTFLGGAHQYARHLIDSGAVDRITSGTAFVMNHGLEHWHPNPDFFFKPGAGPVLDIGPYYITNLVQLIGPVRRVAALAATPEPIRTISSQPRAGETITVETPTTFQALLEFHNNAVVTLCTSWDVWKHEHNNMELYGSEGSLFVPDPNFFGGEVRVTRKDVFVENPQTYDHPFGVANQQHNAGMMANYRGAGLSDMAMAILEGRPHRCSLELSLHVVDVMTSILKAGESGRFVSIETTCERPDPLGIEDAQALLV